MLFHLQNSFFHFAPSQSRRRGEGGRDRGKPRGHLETEQHSHMSHVMRKPVYAICEQQMRRSACASAARYFGEENIGQYLNKKKMIIFQIRLKQVSVHLISTSLRAKKQQQNDLCTQRRLKISLGKSNQNLRCALTG